MNHTALAKLPSRSERAAPTAGAVRRWLAAGRSALRRLADRAIGQWSAVPDEAVLDVRLFPWTTELRGEWRTIRDEALALRPALAAPWAHGEWIEVDATRTPATAAILACAPGVASAGFSFLAPGAHLAPRRGPTKAAITCQLGLVVPRHGDARMRIDGRVVRWAEGETLVFDDTALHEVWNDTPEARIVLAVRFRRPLRQPVRWLAGLVTGVH